MIYVDKCDPQTGHTYYLTGQSLLDDYSSEII
jgi:hypothetical protein